MSYCYTKGELGVNTVPFLLASGVFDSRPAPRGSTTAKNQPEIAVCSNKSGTGAAVACMMDAVWLALSSAFCAVACAASAIKSTHAVNAVLIFILIVSHKIAQCGR